MSDKAAMSEEFVGRGLAFPLHADPTGRIALVTSHSEIKQSIQLILGTAPGERPMRPEFGCAIHDQIFGGVDTETAGRVAIMVEEALVRWEPRITVIGVEVTFGDDASLIYIDVHYSVGDTNDPRNLVFPFYTIPPEA